MIVIFALVAASFVVWYLVDVLRQDTRASHAATTDDLDSIKAELATMRHRLENLEAIAAADSPMLDIDYESDANAADTTGPNAPTQRIGQ